MSEDRMPVIEHDVAVLREWLAAIRTEIVARGPMADVQTIRYYADAALGGEVPHWYTDEYRAKVARHS